jgi:hypothetical protein
MMVRAIRSAIFLAVISLIPATAFAQGRPWFVGGLGGVTFGTVSSGAVGAQFGVQVRPNIFVIGEIGRIGNVTPSSIQDLVDEIVAEAPDLDLEMSAPATYGFGGVRFVMPRQPVSPFVEGGVGFGHISLKIDKAEVFGIDLKDLFADEFGAEDSSTELLLTLGGGVHGRLSGSLGLDVGYRYIRIATDDPAVNTSMLYAAIKFSR